MLQRLVNVLRFQVTRRIDGFGFIESVAATTRLSLHRRPPAVAAEMRRCGG